MKLTFAPEPGYKSATDRDDEKIELELPGGPEARAFAGLGIGEVLPATQGRRSSIA